MAERLSKRKLPESLTRGAKSLVGNGSPTRPGGFADPPSHKIRGTPYKIHNPIIDCSYSDSAKACLFSLRASFFSLGARLFACFKCSSSVAES